MTPDSQWPASDGTPTSDVDDDTALRQALVALDPASQDASEADPSAVEQAWVRVVGTINPPNGATGEPAPPLLGQPTSTAPRRRWWELAAAACLGAALVGGTVLASPTLTTGGSDSGVVASDSGAVAGAPGDGAASSSEPYVGAAADASSASSSAVDATASSSSIARSASATVATDDTRAARDSYVDTITGLGGRVTSETVTTAGAGDGPVQPMPADAAIYPPIYSGAGIFLDVEIPAAQYDQAVAAIPPLGTVIELSQSSYDTGSSIAEGEARITALQQSLARLQALLSQATSVSEVIELENAITARQSELDALTAQQRYLTDQVEKSRISLRLLTPQDAENLSGTADTWWGSFTAGVAAAWMWLGRALAWTSPLWIAGLLWWLVRRRHARRTSTSGPAHSDPTNV